jgi:outer membrane lipoprotein-sorting protein
MKKLIAIGLGMVVLTALAVGFPHQANGQSAGLVSSVLSRLEKNRAELKSLRAKISMEKYNSQLHDSDKSYGDVAYVPGAGQKVSVLLEWNKPQHEILAVANGRYTLFRPRLKEAYTGTVNGKGSPKGTGNILELLNLNRQQLQTRFEPFQEVREETIWGGVSTIHLKLVPKGGANYKYAEIWVDSSGMPVQSKVVEKNDDTTTVRLSSPERNVKISPDEFAIKLGSDVKIIRG